MQQNTDAARHSRCSFNFNERTILIQHKEKNICENKSMLQIFELVFPDPLTQQAQYV